LPQVIVDLGADYDYGCATYGWGASGTAQVFGIGGFSGDASTGERDAQREILALGERLVREYQYPNTVRIWKTSLDEAAEVLRGPIDILHIDGLYTARTLDSDLDKWLLKLAVNGLVVVHGTRALPETVGERFDKLAYLKTELKYAAGLGIASKDSSKIDLIDREWKLRLSPHGSVLRHAWFDQLCIKTGEFSA
jgi:hypothetical protein